MVQWLRISLAMQGTHCIQVQFLVLEDTTCRGTTELVRLSSWIPQSRAHGPQLQMPAHLQPVSCNKSSHPNKKPPHRDERSPCSPKPEKVRVQQCRSSAAKSKALYSSKAPRVLFLSHLMIRTILFLNPGLHQSLGL